MATGTCHLPRFPMHTSLKFFFRHDRTQCMLLDECKIGMTAVTCLFDVRDIGHRFGILTWKDVVFSMAIITVSRPLCPLHNHLRMKALLILFLRLPVTNPAVHLSICGLLPPAA